MAKNQYLIADNTIDPDKAVEGLSELTFEAAQEWIDANQVELETPITLDTMVFTNQYSIQPDNHPEEED
jgi:hypothetical protein